MRRRQVHSTNIGELAGLERADAVGKPQSLGPSEGHEAQEITGLPTNRFSSGTLEQSGKTSLFQQVAGIVADNPIASQADPCTSLQHRPERRGSMSQLGIGLRTMRDTGTRGRNPPQIIRAAVNTMSKERGRGEQAKLIEIADRRDAKRFNRDVAAPEIFGKRPLRHPNELSLGR